ncbi:hypothetical protein [Microbispora sp. H10670]|uniref:hypothetical protein n=1 Tax=Microbispora sp. H10670 TaxID=2729108 RepID=UPI0016039E3D|nr:hypothetical protein [Microbispora sp. H10670]
MRGRRFPAFTYVVAGSVLLSGLLTATPANAGASALIPTRFVGLSKVDGGPLVNWLGSQVCADTVFGRLVRTDVSLPVPNVTVVLTGVPIGIHQNVVTNSTGNFSGTVYTRPRFDRNPPCRGIGGTVTFAGNSVYAGSSATYA